MSYSFLFFLSISQHTNCTHMYIYIENSDVVYALKEIPQGAKDTKDSNLTIFSCCVNLTPPVLVRHLIQILPKI